METKANYIVVGVFTLVALVGAFAFIYWTAAIGDRGELVELRVRIPGSASGLGRGSAVLFNGVKVGDVRRVYIDVNNPEVAIADTEVDKITPITRSSSAVIGIAGLTGQANIEIKGAGQGEANLLEEAESKGEIAEITADPSAVTNLLQRAQDIFERADTVLGQLEGFTTDVRGPLTDTVRNAQTFSQALADNAAGIDTFLSSVSKLSDELAGVSGKLDGTIQAAENILNAVDPQKIETIVGNVETFTSDLSRASRQIDTIVDGARDAIASVNQFTARSQESLAKVDGILAAVDPAKIRTTVDNIESATRNANDAIASITRAADDLDSTVKSADRIFAAIDPKRVESVVANVDAISTQVAAASEQLSSVIGEVRQTVASIGDVARRSEASLGKVDGIIDAVDPEKIRTTVDNIETATRNANQAIASITRAADDLDGTLKAADRIVAAIDPKKVEAVVGNVDTISAQIAAASERLQAVIDDVRGTVASVGDFARKSQDSLSKVDVIIESIDPARVRGVMTNIEQASRTANAAVADVSKVAQKVGARADDIDRIIGDASQLTQRLNAASVRVDGILVKVDELLGSGEADGLVADARSTLQGFRQVADTLNARLGAITDGIARFSGQGLRDVEALVQDSRRSITRIEQAITDLERNPQRILSGGDGTVRQFDGRARR